MRTAEILEDIVEETNLKKKEYQNYFDEHVTLKKKNQKKKKNN